MPHGVGLANRLSPHFNIVRQHSTIVLQGGQVPFSHNVHKSAGKMTLKLSAKIHRISICYYLTQLESLSTLVSNKSASMIRVKSHLSESNRSKKGDQKARIFLLSHIFILFLIKWTLLAIDSDCLPKVCYLKPI